MGTDELFFLLDAQRVANMGVEFAQQWADCLSDTRWLKDEYINQSDEIERLWNQAD
jgi:hypothetical protein